MRILLTLLALCVVVLPGCVSTPRDRAACAQMAVDGFRPIAKDRSLRFTGKVEEDTARCRGGDKAVAGRPQPWADWKNYWAAGDASTRLAGSGDAHLQPNGRGIDGALIDLEYARVELIKFNLHDNNGTYEEYVRGRGGVGGPALKTWPAMRLPPDHPDYARVGGDGPQLCSGELIRHRTLTGICNDLRNPRMGSAGTPFARNVTFDTTFPDLGKNALVRNRHGDRLGLLQPDPQVISRRLFTRPQSDPDKCRDGLGLPGYSPDAQCDYAKAPFFNVLAAFWIQFMTHDWFSHLREGHNAPARMATGCGNRDADGDASQLPPEEVAKLGCRPGDKMDRGYVAEDGDPAQFQHAGQSYLSRAWKTTQNTNTAWWDASQIYGFDETSGQRVKRDPADRAKLLLRPVGARTGGGEAQGYLTTFAGSDPIAPDWTGQETAGFADNWTIGMSFYHNLFSREHNLFVEAFRKRAAARPDADSGLRNPDRPTQVIRYRDVTDDELFEAARLVVSAEIAKIHTTEWTTQLLYDEPLYRGMNANWHGLVQKHESVANALEKLVVQNFGKSEEVREAAQWYSVFAAGPGIFGLGSHVYAKDAIFAHYDPAKTDIWNLANPDHVNGGVNHFGSPFNFPEEFVTVYRLHSLVPDLLEYRDLSTDPNAIRLKIPVVETFRGKATAAMRDHGLANWALTMGRQRLGLLTLQNQPRFLQNLPMPRIGSSTGRIDVAALDLIRDREHGVPRFNEFRRQYGLLQLTSFDDFVDTALPKDSPARREQERLVGVMREIYGQHRCDASKIITTAQRDERGSLVNDCLGHPDGSMVDNIEDVDTVVGWHAEFPRPHGFAISETQFQVFILNASRRLFSDRFLTSSFRPEFYSTLGVEWVKNNGPDGRVMEPAPSNGHPTEVMPLKRVLLRTMPELAPELKHVVNAFDPWARDRGQYYTLQWQPRRGAEGDPAFRP